MISSGVTTLPRDDDVHGVVDDGGKCYDNGCVFSDDGCRRRRWC